MLARVSKIRHPLGAVVDLPRLVPAFSSKGFPFIPEKNAGRNLSQVTLALETVGPFIKGSILLSAYDIFHRHLRKPSRFYEGKELIFIDSGGYELSPFFDSTEPTEKPRGPRLFTVGNYEKILRGLPKNLPFAIANFDWGANKKSLANQILKAQTLFRKHPNYISDFIVKPGLRRKFLNVDEVVRHTKKLQAFNILGVTEKELGKDLLERLKNLAKIRAAMDRDNIQIPIHVWGGLDPILTPLYFFVGAEIFDGVSWLRYAYFDGAAIYRDAYGILELNLGVETPTDHVNAYTLSANTSFLNRLTSMFIEFVNAGGKDFSMFGIRASSLQRAYRTLSTAIPELKGAAQ